MARSIRLVGGWRKRVYKKGNRVVSYLDKKSMGKKRLEECLRWEEWTGGRKLISVEERGKEYKIVQNYIAGEIRWSWNKKNSFLVGQKLAESHKKGVWHMDVKPGNVLWQKGKIKAMIDFEEMRQGKQWQEEDIANTISWVVTAGGDEAEFWRGYGGGANAKMNKLINKYLKKRMAEGVDRAFIQLAKKRLAEAKARVVEKILEVDGLAKYRKENKNKKIVLAIGAFELLHWGHIGYLKKVNKKGDLVVLGIMSDASRKRIEGKAYSIIGERTRAETLAYFDNLVDKTVVVEGDDIRLVIEKLRPEVVMVAKKDIDRGLRSKEELAMVVKYGGKVVVVEHNFPRISSSQMIGDVAMQKIDHVLGRGKEMRPILRPKKKIENKKIIGVGKLNQLGQGWRKKNKTVVFTSLSADLFHVGHARFIQKAKSLGDILVVGLPSNKSLRRLKGPSRPIVDEKARAMVLSALPDVDRVVIFDEDTILATLKKLKPEVFFTVKEDWNAGLADSPEAKFMQSIGGKIVRSERMAPYISASLMIDKAAGEVIKDKFAQIVKTADGNPVIDADFDPFSPAAQLAAREQGFYKKVLEEVGDRCVFCDLKDKYLITKQEGVVLTVALYPYIDGHMLIIPRRHVESVGELTSQEWGAVKSLKTEAQEKLKAKLGIENYWFLVREGNGIAAGKTVGHLHFHVLPYNSQVVKMGETKLNILPIDLAKKLRNG